MPLVTLTCPLCDDEFLRKPYEVKRNASRGRTSLCSRSCQATWMNMSEAKQRQTKEMLAERNANQWKKDNPNWRHGRNEKPRPTEEDR